ncbi:hypothetical protein, partial [Burkholderia sp. SIMBA_024]|uniref:hypothetical protein n=1 Tax=Burkholderia sp. SIMBA_024 TaxID=3085768 RepID=UPI00397ACECC
MATVKAFERIIQVNPQGDLLFARLVRRPQGLPRAQLAVAEAVFLPDPAPGHAAGHLQRRSKQQPHHHRPGRRLPGP